MGMKYGACALAALCLAPLLPGQNFYLRSGDHVIFYSSDPAGGAYGDLIESFVLTRMPQHDVLFSRGEIEPRALPGRPIVVVTTSVDGASAAFRGFLQGIQATSLQVRQTELNTAAVQTGGGEKRPRPAELLAVDVAGALRAVAEKVRGAEPMMATMLETGTGRSQAGPLLIAQAVLETWHAPGLVSEVEIDALRGTVVRADNTTVRDMENGRVVAWTQDDQALPMAVDIMDPPAMLAVQSSGLAKRLDSQMLRVRGMAAERYRFTIDGELVGVFHRDQLDAGLNLALLRTPMWKRAMSLLVLVRKHDELRAARSRLMETPPAARQSQEWRTALEALDAEEAEVVKEQQAAAKAGTHDYEFQPVEQ
jgi:hypothetical protein